MQYTRLKEQLKDFSVFSLSDIRAIEPTFHRTRLYEWQKKGYIKKLRRAHYYFADTTVNDDVLFFMANRLYAPSYVSFEMALSRYGLIPESVYGVTSATSRKRIQFKTPVATFIYRQMRAPFLFGYTVARHGHTQYKIADMEKAIVDHLYINPHVAHAADFEGMRFNREVFMRTVDRKKLKRYVAAFQNKRLAQRVENFLKYLQQ